MPTYRLTPHARQTLEDEGVPVAAYVRWAHFGLADRRPHWYGDECGCTDDRCIGYHHDEDEECGCLRVLIGQYFRAGGKVRQR